MSLLSVLWLCTFQMGLIIYVSLFLLTPKILSLPFDPQDNAFLSWAHFLCRISQSILTAGSVECSLLHQWKASGGGHIHFKRKTFAKSVNTFNNNRVWCLFLNWWHLTTLNKQGDNIQLWHTPFPIWNQSVVPCPVLTVASWPVYRFLRRRVRWSGIPISLRIFHNLLSSHSQRFYCSQWSRK